MKISVLGAGLMCTGVVFDLLKNPKIEKINVVDNRQDSLAGLKKRFKDSRIFAHKIDISMTDSLKHVMDESDCVVNASHYKFNFDLTEACIEAGVNFCDMGGNVDVVEKQLGLDAIAREKGITAIPDCGLAPGMVSILAMHLMKDFDEVDSVNIRVGGIPQRPKTPLNYQLVFSVEGLINEYVERAVILKNGERVLVDSMTDIEELCFPAPFGIMEAFYTSGGTSTLPKTLYGRVKNVDYKTIRYPGHCNMFRMFLDMGLASSVPVEIAGQSIIPRKLFGELLKGYLPYAEPDAVLVRIDVIGKRGGKTQRESRQIVDLYDKDSDLSAMQRTTAFPVSIIAQMLASGEISAKGVIPQELAVPSDQFICALSKRNINMGTEIL